ncbi:uncharacterized protein [Nicotiana tomentosiformis]|uniref:uncharacterized protein n=1 Tax=Nicotiana tomentosiformis TaxID=4098 RepID=UPI00388CB372
MIETDEEWDPEGSIELIQEEDDPKMPPVTLMPILVQIQSPIEVEKREATERGKWKKLVQHKKAVKGQALADHLAENPIGGEYEPLKMYFPDAEVSFVEEDITEAYDVWRMFFDGSANFKGVGIGAVLVLEIVQHYPVQGEWATKNTKILPYLYYVQEMMKIFMKIEFRHVPRFQNEFADALATLSSMIQHSDKNFIDPIPVRIHNQPAYSAHVEEEDDGNLWFHDIKEYLAEGEYLDHANHTK